MKKVLALLALTVALTASAVTMQPQRSFTAKVFNKSQLVNAKAPKFNIPQAKPMRAALPSLDYIAGGYYVSISLYQANDDFDTFTLYNTYADQPFYLYTNGDTIFMDGLGNFWQGEHDTIVALANLNAGTFQLDGHPIFETDATYGDLGWYKVDANTFPGGNVTGTISDDATWTFDNYVWGCLTGTNTSQYSAYAGYPIYSVGLGNFVVEPTNGTMQVYSGFGNDFNVPVNITQVDDSTYTIENFANVNMLTSDRTKSVVTMHTHADSTVTFDQWSYAYSDTLVFKTYAATYSPAVDSVTTMYDYVTGDIMNGYGNYYYRNEIGDIVFVDIYMILTDPAFSPTGKCYYGIEDGIGQAVIWFNNGTKFQFPAAAQSNPGDVNGDGAWSMSDVTTLIAYVLGNNPSPCVVENCDVNGDGTVSMADVTTLIAQLLGN